jgi:hypothetical protein
MTEKPSGRFDGVVLSLLALSLLLNIAVVWWFVKGRGAVTDRQGAPDVAIGSTLRPIVGVSPSGQPTMVSYGGDTRPIVLYVFSPACRWCQRNLDSVNALSRSAGMRFRFVGVSLSVSSAGDPPPYAFPIVQPTEPIPFRATPQTVVVASDGRVLRNWIGAFVGRNKVELEAFFSAQLPGIEVRSQGVH